MVERRVFIALHVSDEAVKEVARIQEQLKNKLQFIGKTTELENLHLTLKFLGEINDDTLAKVKEKLKTIHFRPIKLKLGHVGAFSYKGMPRIVWIKIFGDAVKIQKQIDECLQDMFPVEERFMSHMTIARVKYMEDIKYAKEYLKHLKLPQISWTENKIQLKESRLEFQGPIHTSLEDYFARDD